MGVVEWLLRSGQPVLELLGRAHSVLQDGGVDLESTNRIWILGPTCHTSFAEYGATLLGRQRTS